MVILVLMSLKLPSSQSNTLKFLYLTKQYVCKAFILIYKIKHESNMKIGTTKCVNDFQHVQGEGCTASGFNSLGL